MKNTKENAIQKHSIYDYTGIPEVLLIDRTTKTNIIWGTSNYLRYGFAETDIIKTNHLGKGKNRTIRPRNSKSQLEQRRRSKDMAEVFTPSWICNIQNNLIDDEWFGYKNAFNFELDNTWEATKKVNFNNKNWKDYVDVERIEITCGEAPYLTSRYDVVSGKYIEPKDRIGLLDRKLRVVSENVDDKDEWIEQAIIAYKRVYGYDYQGDNIFLARENLLSTFIDYYFDKYTENPNQDTVFLIATIISWNIWQMDGIKYVIPDSCYEKKVVQISLFDEDEEIKNVCRGCESGDIYQHNGKYVKIKDWRTNKIVKFIDLLR